VFAGDKGSVPRNVHSAKPGGLRESERDGETERTGQGGKNKESARYWERRGKGTSSPLWGTSGKKGKAARRGVGSKKALEKVYAEE